MLRDVSKVLATIESLEGKATLSTERIPCRNLRVKEHNQFNSDSYLVVPSKDFDPEMLRVTIKVAMCALYNDFEADCDHLELMDVLANAEKPDLHVIEMDFKNDSVNITFSNPSLVVRSKGKYNHFVSSVNQNGVTQFVLADILSYATSVERIM